MRCVCNFLHQKDEGSSDNNVRMAVICNGISIQVTLVGV